MTQSKLPIKNSKVFYMYAAVFSWQLIWTDTQGSMTYIAKLLNFVDVSRPRTYYGTKNKWPQKYILYQFPHYFFTHLNPQMVSKGMKNMYKSMGNLHIGPPLILKFWPVAPLATWAIHWPYDPGISAPVVTTWRKRLYLSVICCCRVLFLSSFMVVVGLSKSTTCLHFHTFIYSKYDVI